MNYTKLDFDKLITYYLIDAKISILVGSITIFVLTVIILKLL